MGSAGGTKNTFGSFVVCRGGGGGIFIQKKKTRKNNAALERAFSITLAEILKVYGQANAENYNQFSGDKKHKQWGGMSHLIATTFVNKLSSCLSTVHHTQHSNRS